MTTFAFRYVSYFLYRTTIPKTWIANALCIALRICSTLKTERVPLRFEPGTCDAADRLPDNILRWLLSTGLWGEDLRLTSGLELGALTLFVGGYSLTNGAPGPEL